MPTFDPERLASWSDHLAARLARPRGAAAAALRPGLPRSIGNLERGTELLEGRTLLGGERVAGADLWSALPATPEALREAHGFGWLDDLAAVPLPEAEARARLWTAAWIDRFGDGRGPGWTADLAGRRALRLVQHAEALAGVELGPTLAHHAGFLARRAAATPAGLPRIEALAGLVHAAFALDPGDERGRAAVEALEAAADGVVDRAGEVASRSPELLARALLLLGWTAAEAAACGHPAGPGLAAALARGGATLRALTQAGGRLPRFHGGGAAPGLADAALGVAGRGRATPVEAPAMGYARLRHGRTGVVVDAAPPPAATAATAHASTLALELTVAGWPLVVNCGPGGRFGPRWGRASRATASHSTLALDGFSSSRFGRDGRHLTEMPQVVRVEREETEAGTRLAAAHDGYAPTHGLRHERTLELARDGRLLAGEDALLVRDQAGRHRFDRMRRSGGVRFALRFHLDPRVTATLEPQAVALRLPSGLRWRFEVATGSGTATSRLALEPSVVFPEAGFEPEPTLQIALFSSADEYATRIAWRLVEVPGAAPLGRDGEATEGP